MSKELSGIELDRAIAERVFGWKPVAGQTALAPFAYKRPDGHVVHPYSAPKYSESIEAAMQVVEKMRELGYSVEMGAHSVNASEREWRATFNEHGRRTRSFHGNNVSLAHAVSCAALAAIESKHE